MKKLHNLLGSIEKVLACIFLILTTLMAFLQVLNRHIFHFEIMGIGDLCVYSYIICLFFAFAYAAKENSQTAVEVIQDRLRKLANGRIVEYYIAGLELISILVVIVFLFPLYNAAKKAARYPEWGTLIRWFNQSWLIYILFFTFCLCLFHMIFILVERFGKLRVKSDLP